MVDEIGREQIAQYRSAVGDNKQILKDQKISHTNQVHKQNECDEHTADALTLSAIVVLPSGQECRQCVGTRQLNNSETIKDLAQEHTKYMN